MQCLRPQASSRKPQVSFCEPQITPTKESKNRPNAWIRYLLRGGAYIMSETSGNTWGKEKHFPIKPYISNWEKLKVMNRYVKNGMATWGLIQSDWSRGCPKYSTGVVGRNWKSPFYLTFLPRLNLSFLLSFSYIRTPEKITQVGTNLT